MKNKMGKYLKECRETKKLTQLELSKMSGVSKTYICDIERGVCQPSLKTLQKINCILDLDFNYLLKMS